MSPKIMIALCLCKVFHTFHALCFAEKYIGPFLVHLFHKFCVSKKPNVCLKLPEILIINLESLYERILLYVMSFGFMKILLG